MVTAALLAILAPCSVRLSSGKRREPSSLQAMLDCQQGALQAASDRYLEKKGGQAPADLLDAWRDRQRAEMRSYVARHPGASIDGETPPARAPQAPGSPRPVSKPSSGGETDEGFRTRLWKESEGGRAGVTPEMAREMAERIRAQQGAVSPDMQALLDAVSKDGSSLTPATMEKLRAAARQASGQGLDLGVSPEIQDALLRPADPDERRQWRRGRQRETPTGEQPLD